jgi:hypothetical protein
MEMEDGERQIRRKVGGREGRRLGGRKGSWEGG